MDGIELQVLTTHFGFAPEENLAQTEALLGADWLGHPACTDPAIVAGDFNVVPWSRGYRRLSRRLRDAQVAAGRPMPQATFPARWPFLRIDHLFVSPSIRVLQTKTLRTALTRVASDHLPLVMDFEIAVPAAPSEPRLRARPLPS
jgi:endonuclease/exonuclease/phosphatase family metal-dependent hydrolase